MSEPLNKLIEEFSKLPGIGKKTAMRLALHFVKSGRGEAEALAKALTDLGEKSRPCSICNNISEGELCFICANSRRDSHKLMVVEEISDLMAVEAAGSYKGRYFVLMGALSPLDGIGPEDTKVGGLVELVEKGGVEEVIIATNPNLKGEATALYVAKKLKPIGVKLTRIAYGVPVGGILEYSDAGTLTKAFEGRTTIE
ncbi:MAG: recombination mediator RecR [Nitrospirota bacterium]